MHMKSVAILIFFCLNHLIGAAQIAKPEPEPTPITKDSALKIRDIHEALNLLASDSIVQGTVSLISRKSSVSERRKPAKGFADPIIVQMFSQSQYRDRLVFEDFIVIRAGKQVKLEPKTYVLK